MTSLDFSSLKRVAQEYDELIDFIDEQLAVITDGATRGAWHYSIEVLPDDTISIDFVDRWDDNETITLTWDELMDSTGEKYKARQLEELRKREEETQRLKREFDLRQLKAARETVARLEAEHPNV